MKHTLAAALCAGVLALSASAATASPISFHVDVNTAPLIGSLAGPFAIDFQLTDGSGTLAAPNTVTLSHFVFGGGGTIGAPSLSGGAAGDLSSTVVLTDSGAFLNEFFQAFTPGTTLSFDLTMTSNVDPGSTPDAFSMAILDGSLANLPTTGLGDSLLLVNIGSTSLGLDDVHTFVSTGPAGVAATALAAVPEPASLFLLGVGLLGVAARWRQRRARS